MKNATGFWQAYDGVIGDVELYISHSIGYGKSKLNQIKLYNTDYSLYKTINLPAEY